MLIANHSDELKHLLVFIVGFGSSQYFGVNLPMSFRRGASVLNSPMDEPRIFEMILGFNI